MRGAGVNRAADVGRVATRAGALATLAVAAAFTMPAVVLAGTAGPTESLGSARGLEYLVASHDDVDSPAGAPADCDAGKSVLGGGGAVSGPAGSSRLVSSYPTSADGTAWTAEGARLSGELKTVKTFAICGAPTNTYIQDSFSHAPGVGVDDAACPDGTRLSGGGVNNSNRFVLIQRLFPITATQWLYNGDNRSSETFLSSVHGVCNASLDLRYRAGDAVGIPRGKSRTAVARCTQTQAVTGGGYDDATGSSGISPTASRPWDSRDRGTVPDDGWLVRIRNPGGGRDFITPWAVCKQP